MCSLFHPPKKLSQWEGLWASGFGLGQQLGLMVSRCLLAGSWLEHESYDFQGLIP